MNEDLTVREVMRKLHDEGVRDRKTLISKTEDITGTSHKRTQAVFYEEFGPMGKTPLGQETSGLTDGLTEEQLRMKHDNTYQIREALKKLEPGVYVPQATLVRKLNLRPPYKETMELPEFDKYRGKASGGIVYWGHPESIRRMKDEGILF